MASDKKSTVIGKVFENLAANAISDALFVADTKSIEFSLQTSGGSNFKIRCIASLQTEMPDPSLAVGVDNDYAYVVYNDETASGSYNAASPFNPAGAVSKIFRFNTEGVRWAFIEIFDYAGGSVIVSNVLISDNL